MNTKNTEQTKMELAHSAKSIDSAKPIKPANSDQEAYQPGAHSCFRSTLLSFARNQLNLMLSEICQLKQHDADFSSNEKLTTIVLTKIASGEIHSPHISQDQATNYLKLLSSCDSKEQAHLLQPNPQPHSPQDEEEPLSPYFSSPF